MRIVWFSHSLVSCWNHGNAHFLRGVARALVRRGHTVEVYEPADGWSLANLRADHGEAGEVGFARAYPDLSSTPMAPPFDLARTLDGADLVVAHEWTEPALVAAIGRMRRHGGRFTLLFHDTHHRAVSDPEAIRAFHLGDYDGVLAFGESLAEVYRRWGWGRRVFTWHEAADVTLFRPPPVEPARRGLVWVGNWGDGERSAEIESYLMAPAAAVGLPLDIHGVRYPPQALAALRAHGAVYRGWAPNTEVPAIFARHLATAHIPRRFYVDSLPGIPTIRVFEALACGIPLISAPWRDSEGLFRVGDDFLMAHDPAAMTQAMRAVAKDADLRAALSRGGLETILARHTCDHRAEQLLAIVAGLGATKRLEASA